MPITYTPIATTIIGTPTNVVTFSSIPNTYTDLIISGNFVNSSASSFALITVNGDTGTNYSLNNTYAEFPSTIGTNRTTNASSLLGGYYGTAVAGLTADFMDYKNTVKNKTILIRTYTNSYVIYRAATWRSTSAINSITLTTSAGNFATNSQFTLYGIQEF